MRDTLERIPVPGADAARERASDVVLAAFRAREPVAYPARGRRVGIGIAIAVAALGLAVASPPGTAVVDRVREAVGAEHAAPALFSLPAPGRLLVASDGGVWVVDRNGEKRLLGGYRDASWSPFGRFLVATRADELAALEPGGEVRWTLARPDAGAARWHGSRTDTRIAYVDRSGIRIVAGDGTGDRLLAPAETGPLAWRPGRGFELAYVTPEGLRVRDADSGRVLARANVPLREELHTDLEWSSDGRRLLVVNGGVMRVVGRRGELVARAGGSRRTIVDAVFRPGTHDVLVAQTTARQSTVYDLESEDVVFSGTGVFDEITPSPDGRWLLVEWRTADQWVFVRLGRPRVIRAVSGIASQFRGKAVVAGWCCSR